MSKNKKGKKAIHKPESSTTNENWYEEARTQGYLNQEPKNKKAKQETGNRLDQGSLDQLATFKKNLEVQKEKDQKEAISQAKKKAQEEEKSTHWFELAEKKGYLDDY